MFVFLLRISCHSNVCENFFYFCFTDFRKAIACLCVAYKSRQTLSYMWKFIWEKKLVKQKYITQLNSVLFINITKDLLYYILPTQDNAWNAVFLWIRPPREIYSPIFYLKHMKTDVPIIIIRIVSAKLNEEAPGKVKSTSKNDRRSYPSLLKFGQ